MTKRVRVLLVTVLCAAGIAIPVSGAQLNVSSAALTTFRTCTLTGLDDTSPVVIDAGVRENSPTNNYGTANNNEVRSQLLANRRWWVRFDLTQCSPQIPAAATVTSATIRLFTTGLPNACRTQDIFRATASWTETGVTWNTQPTLNGTRTDSMDIGPTGGGCENNTNNQYVTGWNVTSDINLFRSGTTNNGWMIRDNVESSATSRAATFVTRDANNVSRGPQLVVEYKL